MSGYCKYSAYYMYSVCSIRSRAVKSVVVARSTGQSPIGSIIAVVILIGLCVIGAQHAKGGHVDDHGDEIVIVHDDGIVDEIILEGEVFEEEVPEEVFEEEVYEEPAYEMGHYEEEEPYYDEEVHEEEYVEELQPVEEYVDDGY